MKFKSIVLTIAVLAIIVALSAGGVYFVLEKRKNDLEQRIALVKGFIQAEKYDEAQAELRPLLTKVTDAELGGQLRVIYMDVLLKNGETEDAKSVGLKLIAQYPEASASGRAQRILGEIDLEEGHVGKAEERFKIVLEQFPDLPDVSQAKLGLALVLVKERHGRLREAKQALEALQVDEKVDAVTRQKAEDALGDVNVALLLSQSRVEGEDITYKIKLGDTIDDIARTHKVTKEILMRSNRISDPTMLVVNTRIKVPIVDFSLVVDKWDNTLLLLNHEKFFKRYPVRTGRQSDETPTGEFKIISKSENPRWVDPNTHREYPPNHPENELGTRWMAFEGSMLGIHGTIKPETIGKYASNGCVGMLKEDVEELFDLVRRNTPLKIVGKQNPKIVEESREKSNAL